MSVWSYCVNCGHELHYPDLKEILTDNGYTCPSCRTINDPKVDKFEMIYDLFRTMDNRIEELQDKVYFLESEIN